MLTLLRTLNIDRRLLIAEAPSLVVSLLIAEFFYKFHSFLLECLAFLFTWYVVGLFAHTLDRTVRNALKQS